MEKPDKQAADGSVQAYQAPAKLAGHVIDWRDGGAIQGIGVLDDLARHYSPHEVLLLGLTGKPPSKARGRAFAVAVTWISACHVGQAPTHAAVLTRVSGGPCSALVGTAALVAAREADEILRRHRALLDWLDGLPAGTFDGWPERDPVWRARLLQATGLDLAELEIARDEASAALIVFHKLGVTDANKLVGVWAWSRMIGALSEALADRGLDIRSYPLHLPNFVYEESQ